MATLTSQERTYQHLVDARLDVIDRNLMDGGVSRGERSEIVHAVEEQIAEMLAADEELTREGVLRVLASLDPPEAYCRSDRLKEPIPDAHIGRGECIRDEDLSRRDRKFAPLAIAALVSSILSFLTCIVVPVGTLVSMVTLICSIIGSCQISASHGRLRGTWMTLVGYVSFGIHWIGMLALLFDVFS
jgi:hypothetical protein